MTDPKLDLSDQAVRRIVSKDDDLRLRHELSVSQSSINREYIDQLQRYELVGYVTLLRQLNKMTTSCRNVIAGFDPSKAVLHPKDNDLKGRSQSCSDNTESELGGATASSSGVGKQLVISDQLSHSITATKDDSSARLELLLLTLEKSRKEEREERDERDRRRDKEAKEEREQKERDRERKDRLDREDQERVKKVEREEVERIRREEREERERVRERKEKVEREELDRVKKEEREERERVRERKEKVEREERERVRKEDLMDKEERRLQKEQQVKADREALYEKEKLDREEREKIRIQEREERADDRLDSRKLQEALHNEAKEDRLKHDAKFEIRLKRASDIFNANHIKMADDLKGIVAFFQNMESLFAAYAIDEDLKVCLIKPFLNRRANQVVIGLEVGTTYEQVKNMILTEYNFTPRMYRAAFTDSFRSLGESATQFIARITLSLRMYLDSKDVGKSFELLFNLILCDRFKDTLDDTTRYYIADHEHDACLDPKQIGRLVDLYQSERHPNWSYLRNPSNFKYKTGNTGTRSYNGTPVKHAYMRYDKSRLVCTYCKKKGHVSATCFMLTNPSKNVPKPSYTRNVVPARVRQCFICSSVAHFANRCPDRNQAKAGKVFNTKRVTVELLDHDMDTEYRFNDLLNAAGVKADASSVEFNGIEAKRHSRINSITGVHGYVPSVRDDMCSGLIAVGGGNALHDQIGVVDKFVGHLVLDSQPVHSEVEGEVDQLREGGGDSSSDIELDDQRLFDVGKRCVPAPKTYHRTNNRFKYHQEHVVYVDFNGCKLAMLLDSGTQVSVVRTELLRECDVSNNIIHQVKLLGAFGDPVPAKVISIEAKLLDNECAGLSNQPSVHLKVALCDKLNGDTGLLSIADYNLLTGIEAFVPGVKIHSNSGRLCLECKKVDVPDLVDNNITSNNDLRNVWNGGKFVSNNMLQCDLTNESYKSFKEDQLNDSSLICAWSNAANGSKEYAINEDNGLLYHNDQIGGVDIFQLVVPISKRHVIITSSHDSNWSLHFGSIKTIQRIKAYFFWPSMVYDVKKFVSSCELSEARSYNEIRSCAYKT